MGNKLFLEPHYGDIAWSCSGYIAKHKNETIIVNLFPPKRKFYRLKLKAPEYRRKKMEEKKFQNLFGVKIEYMKFKSAFMRGRTIENLFDKKLNAIEEELVLEIRNFIKNYAESEKISEIYCPLAQRNQVDHLIVKKAIQGFSSLEIPVYYYEDFPNFIPESSKHKFQTSLEKIEIDISDVINEKIAAIKLYPSLIIPYFKSLDSLIDSIKKNPIEVFWKE